MVAQRRGRWTDYFCGLIAGAGAGLAASATIACIVSVVDLLPRALLSLFPGVSPWMAALLWLLLACVSWTLLGAAFGLLLTLFGSLGNRVVEMLGAPFAWLLRLCGLNRLAEVFSA